MAKKVADLELQMQQMEHDIKNCGENTTEASRRVHFFHSYINSLTLFVNCIICSDFPSIHVAKKRKQFVTNYSIYRENLMHILRVF